MNPETFGMTFQYAICLHFKIENDISVSRTDKNLLKKFINSKIIDKIFKNKPRPTEYLTSSKKFTSPFISRCPHNFLLENEETFSVRTFKGNGKMFAPKVVGQSGWKVFNHFFGHLSKDEISRDNFKAFCLNNVEDILPILIDYALVSDFNCWFYRDNDSFKYEIIQRKDLPDLTFDRKDFSFTNNRKTYTIDSFQTIDKWNEESNSVKYISKTILELQIHKKRQYKIRLHRDNFPKLLKEKKKNNNSMLGDTAELAICDIFELSPGNDSDRLKNNSDKTILSKFISHYKQNKTKLFPLSPVKYSGTEKRERGGSSKSGVDFYLENNHTLSVKTNKSKAYKVCPPEIGQPAPKTFDLYFSNRGWYNGNMDKEKFKKIVRDKSLVVLLLKEYIKFLNECDFILWSVYDKNKSITSQLIKKSEIENFTFDPNLIHYTNDFVKTSSVVIHYPKGTRLGEFQVHSARNSLKFCFYFGTLLSLKNDKN